MPVILRRQEARVREAARAVEVAEDEAAALRLRQRALMQHGRLDLARALDAKASAKEAELAALRQQLADEEEALEAYRGYAVRVAQSRKTPAAP